MRKQWIAKSVGEDYGENGMREHRITKTINVEYDDSGLWIAKTVDCDDNGLRRQYTWISKAVD